MTHPPEWSRLVQMLDKHPLSKAGIVCITHALTGPSKLSVQVKQHKAATMHRCKQPSPVSKAIALPKTFLHTTPIVYLLVHSYCLACILV